MDKKPLWADLQNKSIRYYKKIQTNLFGCGIVERNYFSALAFLAASFSLKASMAAPKTQYGIAKVNKKIINQKPIVNMDRNAKKPKY